MAKTRVNLPKVSAAEWEVMRVLWERSPLTANEVAERIPAQFDWHPKTVRTYLRRLTDKGAISKRRHGKVYRYSPLVNEETCVRHETRSFLRRVYGGALTPMLARFLQEEDLTPEDVRELRRVLNGKQEDEG